MRLREHIHTIAGFIADIIIALLIALFVALTLTTLERDTKKGRRC